MIRFLIEAMQGKHPCRKEIIDTIALPDCLSKDDGVCEEYPHALFCPKYGNPVGSVKKYGHMIVRIEEEQ